MRTRNRVFLLTKLLVLTSALLINFVQVHKGYAEAGSTRLYSDSTLITRGVEMTPHWQSHASNDSWYQTDTERSGAFYLINVEMIFSTTADPTTLANITVFSEAHIASLSSPVAIRIYDYVSAAYVPCFNVDVTADTNHTTTFTTNLSNYVNATLDEMRLQTWYRVKSIAQSIYQDHTYIELVFKPDAPVANFTWEPLSPIVGETVTFNATTSHDPDGSIISWEWNFSDGNIGSGEIATHAYSATGDHNVTLTVTDNDGLTDASWNIITVRDSPVASFTYSQVAPKAINFDASMSQPDGGELIDPDSYFWDFGDTTTGNGKIVEHTYPTYGTYNVTLTVTDSEGLSDSTWQMISVSGMHDVAVVGVTPIEVLPLFGVTREVYPTWNVPILPINITVSNEGDFAETLNVTLFYNLTATNWVAVDTLTVTDLVPDSSIILICNWDFSDITPPFVTALKAEAVLIDAVDDDPADNILTDGTVYVKVAGDANGDGSVGILDAGLVSAHWYPGPPVGPLGYHPEADFNNDVSVNILDAAIVSANWS